MLKPIPKQFDECKTCDYWYCKGKVQGCIFPSHAPIDSMFESECITLKAENVKIDEDYVQTCNIVEVTIL